jgi:predicted NAD/FAD-binding protein
MRVAVIGTGIAGNAAAWNLSKRYPVIVYDRELRPGGHSHTVSIDYDGTPIAVDTGFIVYNELNYPGLTALFDQLGVETVQSCMSFAVTADGGRFEWKGGGENWIQTAIGLFAQPRNLLSPSYIWMLRDILTFNQQSIADHRAGKLAGITLGEYFRRSHFAPRLLTDYLAPMGDLVGALGRDAELSGGEFCRILQQPSSAAIRPPGLAHGEGWQQELRGEADGGVSRPAPARLRRHFDRAHAAWRRRQ